MEEKHPEEHAIGKTLDGEPSSEKILKDQVQTIPIKDPPEDPPEDPKRRYCYCQKKNDPLRPMICCDKCLEWYHYDCLNFSKQEEAFWSSAESQEEPWICNECYEIPEKPLKIRVKKQSRSRKRKFVLSDFFDLEASEDQDQ